MDNLTKTNFQLNKIKRAIKTSNKIFHFNRYGVNEFGEVDSSVILNEIEIKGIFHMSSSYQNQIVGEQGKISSKPQPMVLTLYEDGKKIKTDDILIFNGIKYKVVDVIDVNNLNVASEISLEAILNG